MSLSDASLEFTLDFINRDSLNKCCINPQYHSRTPHVTQLQMNYLIDRLPRDLFTHLYQYSKLLLDVHIHSLAKCSQTILRLVGPKYELQGQFQWYFYRVVDIEAVGLKLAWTSQEEKGRYVIQGRHTSPSQTFAHEWVIVRQRLERLIGLGSTSLSLQSLQPNEYQHTARTIGLVTTLILWAPKPPTPSVTPSSSNQATHVPEWSIDLLQLPHLRFIPTTVTDLWMDDLCTNEMEIIQTYEWPRKLQSLRLNGFNPELFNESMCSNWPRSLQKLILNTGIEGGGLTLTTWGGRIYFPSTILSLELAGLDSTSDHFLSASLPKSLTYLKCSPQLKLKDLKLHEISLERLELDDSFNSSIDGWVLPPSLLDLNFGSSFNRPLNGLIFNTSLTRLTLIGFHHSLRGVILPSSLVSLEFGYQFGVGPGETIADIKLPIGLQTLKYESFIDSCVYQRGGFNFPPTLTHLELGYQLSWDVDWKPNDHQLKLVLPVTLLQLVIPIHLLVAAEIRPTNLERLTFTAENRTLDLVTPKVIDRLNEIFASMNQLHHLEFEFNHIATDCDRLVLPDSVTTLIIGGNFFGDSTGRIVASRNNIQRVLLGSKLKQLLFKGEFNQSLTGIVFPESLKEIEFLTDQFNQPLDEISWPSQLEKLTFSPSSKFDRPNEFNQPIHQIQFLYSLKILQLPPGYNQPLTDLIIPPQLRTFDIGDTHDTSQFTHIDSLIQLNFPSTIRWICLPHPASTHLTTHPQLSDYHAWIRRLRYTHPYAYIQFTLIEPFYAADDSDSEDAMDDVDDDDDEDDGSNDEDGDDGADVMEEEDDGNEETD